MSIYGQFCPIAKAVEVIGERWTLLIIRELLVGSTRFNELQRGLARLSPSLLTKRLKELEAAGLVVRHPIAGQRGYEYHLSDAGKALGPVLMEVGQWGINWVTSGIDEDELDIELLMLEMERNIRTDLLPPNQTTVKFHFTDANNFPNWWFILKPENCDLCTSDPGFEPQLYVTTDVRTLTEIWMSEQTWQAAIKNTTLKVMGPKHLTKDFYRWFGESTLKRMLQAG